MYSQIETALHIPHLDVTKLRAMDGERWNSIWRVIKNQAPALAAHLQDPFFKDAIERFGGNIDIPLNQLPQEALDLVPAHTIIR